MCGRSSKEEEEEEEAGAIKRGGSTSEYGEALPTSKTARIVG